MTDPHRQAIISLDKIIRDLEQLLRLVRRHGVEPRLVALEASVRPPGRIM